MQAMVNSRRRKFLVAIGAIGVGTAGTVFSTREADAVSVSMGQMTVPDKSIDGQPENVTINVETDLQWQSNQTPSGIQLVLEAGDTDSDLYEIKTKQVDISQTDGSKTTTISGDVTKSMGLDVTDFKLVTGQESKAVPVEVGLTVTLYNSDMDLATASVSDTAEIQVNRQTGTISVAAEGTWEIS